MIKLGQALMEQHKQTLADLKKLLINYRYDWLYRSLRGTGYYLESAAAASPGIAAHLGVTNPQHELLYSLLALNQAVLLESAEQIFSANLLSGLVEMNLVRIDGELLHPSGHRIVPWLGYYLITTAESAGASAQLAHEHYQLAYELLNNSDQKAESALVINPGAGLTALLAAKQANQVKVWSKDSEAVTLTTVNHLLNQATSSTELSVLDSASNWTPENNGKQFDWVVGTFAGLPLPAEYQLPELSADWNDGATELLTVIDLLAENDRARLQVYAQLSGNDQQPRILEKLRESRFFQDRQTDCFVLTRKAIPSQFFQVMAQLIANRLKELPDAEKIATEIVNASQQKNSCFYSIYLDAKPSTSPKFNLINLSSAPSTDAQLKIPDQLEIVATPQLMLQSKNGKQHMVIDQIQRTIAEQIIVDKFIVQEIAEEVARQHQISYETAATKTIEFCHQLSLQGLIGSPAMSAMRGQMRLMQINVQRFANKLQDMAKELENDALAEADEDTDAVS